MSVVGPRSALSSEVATYNDYQRQRLLVKPGMTCYWQTRRNRDSITFDEWVDLDLWEDGFSSLVARCAEALANDASLRTELSKNAKRLFDGKGAERLARELYGFMATGSWEA